MSVDFQLPAIPQDGWPYSHENANAAARTNLKAAPAKGLSHYISGITISGGSAADGFRILRESSLSFNSATDTNTITDAATLQMGTGDFSISLWFKWITGTVAAVAGLLAKGGATEGYKLELTGTGVPKFTFGDSDESVSLTGTYPVTDGTWHHIVVSVDRDVKTGFVLYVDGAAVATSTDATADPTDIESNVNANGTDITTTGIASVTFQTSALAIYKARALTAANVTTLYNKGVGSTHPGTGATPTADETGIVVAMPMDEGSGDPYDMTTNNNDGTLANVTWADGDGIPADRDTLKRVGFIGCIGPTTQLNFSPALKIGDSKPLALLETDGSFTAIFHGYTDKA